jgi:multidrug efflux pump
VFLFLGDLRCVLIPFLSIPISLLAAFFLMKTGGLSINMFTLLAMVLAVGLVVDDAIVVLENIRRHQIKGLSPFRAAVVGGNEIVFAVVVMTLTLVAVYLPIAFITGRFADIYLQHTGR